MVGSLHNIHFDGTEQFHNSFEALYNYVDTKLWEHWFLQHWICRFYQENNSCVVFPYPFIVSSRVQNSPRLLAMTASNSCLKYLSNFDLKYFFLVTIFDLKYKPMHFLKLLNFQYILLFVLIMNLNWLTNYLMF